MAASPAVAQLPPMHPNPSALSQMNNDTVATATVAPPPVAAAAGNGGKRKKRKKAPQKAQQKTGRGRGGGEDSKCSKRETQILLNAAELFQPI